MNNIQVKNKKRKLIHKVSFLFFGFILLIIFIVGVFSLFFKMQDTIENKQLAEQKLKSLEERKDKLLLDIDGLTTEKGKEKIFRENYGFAREGEGIVVIVEDKNKTIVNEPTKRSFKTRFLDLFR